MSKKEINSNVIKAIYSICGQGYGQSTGILRRFCNMPRRGENIHKRKDGRWEGRYIKFYDSNGKAKYGSVYAKSYLEVKEILTAEKTVTYAMKKTIGKINTKELCEEWLENSRIRLKASSYARYHSLLYNHVIPCLGDKKVKTLTNTVINEFIKQKSEYGRLDGMGGLSAKTVNDILSMLIQIIQYAEKKHYIVGFAYDFIQPKVQVNELPVLTTAEQNQLIQYVLLHQDIEKLGVLFALYTGVRLGELCALQWRDIDFTSGTLKITKTIQRIKNINKNETTKTIVVIDTPKSQKSIRSIPLSDSFLKLLKRYQGQYHQYDYILSGTSKYIEPRIYQAKFKKYLKQAQIQPINFHALRHTFATRGIEQGFDTKSLSEILGHSTVRFTLERYVHSSHELKKAGMEKLAVSYF